MEKDKEEEKTLDVEVISLEKAKKLGDEICSKYKEAFDILRGCLHLHDFCNQSFHREEQTK